MLWDIESKRSRPAVKVESAGKTSLYIRPIAENSMLPVSKKTTSDFGKLMKMGHRLLREQDGNTGVRFPH